MLGNSLDLPCRLRGGVGLSIAFAGPLTDLYERGAGPAARRGVTNGSIGSAPDPRIREFRIEASYDSDTTWRRIPAVPFNGRFVALTPPAPAGHDGYVSLRITARDDKGSTLTQTIPRAYGLSNS